MTREHAADGDTQRSEPPSSAHGLARAHRLDCRLAADEGELGEGLWIRRRFGTWGSWAAG